jgi:hypothetical protein
MSNLLLIPLLKVLNDFDNISIFSFSMIGVGEEVYQGIYEGTK